MGSRLTFTDQLVQGIRKKRSVLCVGIDPQLPYMPPHLCEQAVALYGMTWRAVEWVYTEFGRQIIDAVAPFAVAVKPQIAFDEAYGAAGMAAFEATLSYAKARGLVRITDAKRGDGGDTADAYADGHLGEVFFWDAEDSRSFKKVASPIRSDALTVQPWIAEACFMPFLRVIKEHGTGVFVVDKTSFKPNSRIEQTRTEGDKTNWEMLAELVQELGVGTEGQYGYRNFGVVMGATYPADAPTMRHILPNSWFLIPGYGAQGGGADDAAAGINEDGFGGVVNSARAIIYAYLKGQFRAPSGRFAEAAARAAEFARDELNSALKRAGKLKF